MIKGRSSRPTPTGSGDKAQNDFWPDLSNGSSPHEPTIIRPEQFDTPKPAQKNAAKTVAANNDSSTQSLERPVDETIELDNDPAPNAKKSTDAATPTKSRVWPWQKFGQWFEGLSKKKRALVVVALLALLLGLGAGVYALTRSEPPVEPAPVAVVEPEPEPTTVANTLTGRQVEPEINDRQVTAVIIENSREARPQAGLQEAGVVFEAIAEGGITRFMALYQDTDPASLGPVRSLRPYYLSWAQGFDAAIAHVGGSPEALRLVRERGTKDLDQSFHPAFFQRVTNRYAPHNMFTDINQLRKLQEQKGYSSSNFQGFARNEEGKPVETPTARSIQVNISSNFYNSSYTYNAETNKYSRAMGGATHTDYVSKKQITPDAVVVMVMNYSINSNGIHSIYNTVGTGGVYIFQNGEVIQGAWEKSAHNENIRFTNDSGEQIKLNPGQTWITAVSSQDKVRYQP